MLVHSTRPDLPSSRDSGKSEPLPSALLPTLLALWRQEGHTHWIRAEGISMQPLIRAGDHLLLNHNLATLRRGSIIIFMQNGRLIAHRVIKILPTSPPQFLTKGDNSWSFDASVHADALLGHVMTIQRQGYAIDLDSPKWRALGGLIALATLTVATPYAWLRRLKKQYWGHRQLPGVRCLRRGVHSLVRALLQRFSPCRL